jgi:hypothetical protein
MSKRARDRVPTPVLLSYLDDELSPDEAAAIERVSLDSEPVRRRLEALRTLRRALQAPVPALERREVALAASPPARRAPPGPASRWALGSWLVMGAAATLLLGVGLGQLLPRPEELPSARDLGFRAKSASPTSAAREAGIQAFRLGAAGSSPERVRGSLHQDDGLLFAYTNQGSAPFEHLMIFGVDAEREVRWFHPAYATDRQNPTSVPIRAGQEVPLSEVVWISLPKGPLTLYAAFTRQPLDVWAVEAWLKAHPAGGAGFAGTDAVVSQLAVRVD